MFVSGFPGEPLPYPPKVICHFFARVLFVGARFRSAVRDVGTIPIAGAMRIRAGLCYSCAPDFFTSGGYPKRPMEDHLRTGRRAAAGA